MGQNPLNYEANDRARKLRNAAIKRRMGMASVGLAAVMVFQMGLLYVYKDELASHKSQERSDAPRGAPGLDGIAVAGEKPGLDHIKLDEAGVELLPTGSDSVPYVPRTVRLPAAMGQTLPAPSPSLALPAGTATSSDEEYTLLGHGLRTITFLSIKVYVLGLYVRTADIPELHKSLVRCVSDSPAASALLPGEKEAMKAKLLDADGSREVWNQVLKDSGVRMAVRVVPTRDTDFNHMRDGWVTGITARTQEAARAAAAAAKKGEAGAPTRSEFDDASFGKVMGDFKALFGGRGSLPKGSEVLLMRDERGALAVSHKRAPQKGQSMYTTERQEFGRIEDERLSRLVWQCYLAGPKVSSEAARKSVADGIMAIAERPIGSIGITAS